MAIDYEVPEGEELDNVGGGGNFLKTPGVYHGIVTDVDEQPLWRGGPNKGEVRDGFELEVSVCAGPQTDKSIRLFFRNGQASDSDQGKFSRLVQGRVLEALAIIDPSKRGQKVTIELEDAKGRQFIFGVKAGKTEGYLDPDGGKFWHVDDPNAPEGVERSAAAIDGLIDKAYRRDPASFPKKEDKADAGANAKKNPNQVSGNGTSSSTKAAACGKKLDLSGV